MPVSVYLVEDEEWIRKGIKKMIRWEELGLALSGEAEDGLTAREEILRIRPQIIVSDIRIPRLDGLALVREIQKAYPVKAIFVSGYREFEYARQAIELEAVSYILKPVEKEELNHVLKQTVEALAREQKNRKDADYGKASFLMDVLDERVSDASLSQRTQKTDNCNHCVLLIPGKEPEAYEEELDAILEEREDRMTEAKLFRKGKEEWVIIFSSRNGRQLQERARRLAEMIKKRTDSGGSWALGGTVTGFAGIPVSYHQAWQAYAHRDISSEDGICVFTGAENKDLRLPSGMRIEAVKFAVETADGQKLRQELSLLRQEFYAMGNMGMQEIWDDIFYICMELIRALQKNGIGTGRYYEACRLRMNRHFLHRDIQDAFDWFEGLLVQMCADVKSSRAKSIQIAVEKVREYIDAHYTQSLSLTEMAEMVYVNPNYLSTSFKRLTGYGFVDYVIRRRMDRAAEILRETELGIAETAELTGYENVRHFSRLFRKVWGKTPSEYREGCRRERDT